MPDTIRRLSVEQVIRLLEATRTPGALTRTIDAVHLHHTPRARRADFRGLATLEAMRRFQVETLGRRDLAQHLTVDPEGAVWTGRNWNLPPVSQAGRNGSPERGPFMILLAGDFNAGQDPFDGPQRRAAIDLIAALLVRFGLRSGALLLHRDMMARRPGRAGAAATGTVDATDGSGCPGSGIDRTALVRAVHAASVRARRVARRRVRRPPFSARMLDGHAVTRPLDIATLPPEPPDAAPPESADAVRAMERLAQSAIAERDARLQRERQAHQSPIAVRPVLLPQRRTPRRGTDTSTPRDRHADAARATHAAGGGA